MGRWADYQNIKCQTSDRGRQQSSIHDAENNIQYGGISQVGPRKDPAAFIRGQLIKGNKKHSHAFHKIGTALIRYIQHICYQS
jgi:hypothetical protein